MNVNHEIRTFFDDHLQHVLPTLPPRVHELLEEIPLIVEDYPSQRILQQLGIRHRDELCGLYSGIPLDKKSINDSGQLSESIYLYREGILQLAMGRDGAIDEAELREQIRVTILHELGHHHGLDEDDLSELGYD